MTRETLAQAVLEAADGYWVSAKGLSEDRSLGEPSLANRGAVELTVTSPDGTSLTIQLTGEQAAALVRPIAEGAVAHESEGDIARRYLREQGPFTPELTADLERRAALA